MRSQLGKMKKSRRGTVNVLCATELKDGKNDRFHVRHITVKTKQNQSKGNRNAKLTTA